MGRTKVAAMLEDAATPEAAAAEVQASLDNLRRVIAAWRKSEAARVAEAAAVVAQPAPGPDASLREADAARYCDVSVSFLRAARINRRGHAPGPAFVRLGRRAIRYRASDLDRWLESKRVSGKAAR